jgi:hypothetical protein
MHNNHDKSHHETTTICVTTNQPTNQPEQSILKKATNRVSYRDLSIFNETPQTADSTICLSIKNFDRVFSNTVTLHVSKPSCSGLCRIN